MRKTKYFIAITAAVFVFIIAMVTIFMQDTLAQLEQTGDVQETTAPYDSIRQEIQQRRQEIRDLRESDKKATRQQRITLRGQNVLSRIDIRINRTVKITDKVEEIAKKMQEKGTDAQAALTLIDATREKITKAQTSYKQSKTALDAISGAEDPQAAIKNFKDAVAVAYQDVREVKTSVIETIKTLKEIRKTASTSTN